MDVDKPWTLDPGVETQLSDRMEQAGASISPDLIFAWTQIQKRAGRARRRRTIVVSGAFIGLAGAMVFALTHADNPQAEPAGETIGTSEVSPVGANIAQASRSGLYLEPQSAPEGWVVSVPLPRQEDVPVLLSGRTAEEYTFVARPGAIPVIADEPATPRVSLSRRTPKEVINDACKAREEALEEECTPQGVAQQTSLGSGAATQTVRLGPEDFHTILTWDGWSLDLVGPDPGFGAKIGESLQWNTQANGYLSLTSTSPNVVIGDAHKTDLLAFSNTPPASNAHPVRISIFPSEQCPDGAQKGPLVESRGRSMWCESGIRFQADGASSAQLRQLYETMSIEG